MGGGINGAAIARELALEGAIVHLVDRADIASGATAYSSRLIHGGLRYLEYGEFDLVRESLAERKRMLEMAPQFVRSLRLVIPVRNRFGGVWGAMLRFFRLRQRPKSHPPGRDSSRGLWLVRIGLWLYEVYANDKSLERSRVVRCGAPGAVEVDCTKFRWLCSYSDAQIRYPERFVVALLKDAARAAKESGGELHVHTYAGVGVHGCQFTIKSNLSQGGDETQIAPDAVINATGAWVDESLSLLGVESRRLIGGTKGSHFLTSHAGLAAALDGSGIYAEAPDGRPVFVLPFGAMSLVGTTDVTFTGDPATATASEEELEYLLALVNDIFPTVQLSRADIDLHYSGVRPLPFVDSTSNAAITRRHAIEEYTTGAIPIFSIIGGKLTTCRSLADQAVTRIFQRLNLQRRASSQSRMLPPEVFYPDHTAEMISSDCLPGTNIPVETADRVIEMEWPQTISDLVERRLMLLYHPRLTRACLERLAELMAYRGVFPHDENAAQIEAAIERLRSHFGKKVFDDETRK